MRLLSATPTNVLDLPRLADGCATARGPAPSPVYSAGVASDLDAAFAARLLRAVLGAPGRRAAALLRALAARAAVGWGGWVGCAGPRLSQAVTVAALAGAPGGGGTRRCSAALSTASLPRRWRGPPALIPRLSTREPPGWRAIPPGRGAPGILGCSCGRSAEGIHYHARSVASPNLNPQGMCRAGPLAGAEVPPIREAVVDVDAPQSSPPSSRCRRG